jgi:uncharacterized membrane protein YfcA
MLTGQLWLIGLLAFIMEVIDSGLGMGYGTVLSPLLIIIGWPPLIVVPSILLSQAIGGLTASFFHQKYGNANFKPIAENLRNFRKNFKGIGFINSFKSCLPRDLKIVFMVTIFGIAASIFGALTAIKIPKLFLKTYIGLLALGIGILILVRSRFQFSWKKIFTLGLISAFNKGLSGGGFGPVMTGGQIVSGHPGKNSIGSTTLSEAPICIVGFITYLLSRGLPSFRLLWVLSAGALAGGILGPSITKKINTKSLRMIIGWLIIVEGLWVLAQVVTKMSFGGG